MAKNNNLSDFLSDVANAIREKKGTTEPINAQDFSSEIASISSGDGSGGSVTPSRPSWTGHADAEGLKAIGWTDEDIAYYQEHGVNWNAEDDHLHLVSDDNKALYGVLTAKNISSYRNRIVYLPKIDTSATTNMVSMFYNCQSLVSIPQLDIANVTSMRQMFYGCYSLVSIPQFDTVKVTDMGSMFYNCRSLANIPQMDTTKVTDMGSMFYNCHSLVGIPPLDTHNVTDMRQMFYGCYSLANIPQMDTANVTNMDSMFYSCYSLVGIPQFDTVKVTDMDNMFRTCSALVSIPQLDTTNVTNMNTMFIACNSLTHINLKNAKLSYQLNNSALLSKESLLYLINNEAATSAITIKLASYAYTRLAEDADVVAALANHPNISLAQ